MCVAIVQFGWGVVCVAIKPNTDQQRHRNVSKFKRISTRTLVSLSDLVYIYTERIVLYCGLR
jgi:hypothetical protein